MPRRPTAREFFPNEGTAAGIARCEAEGFSRFQSAYKPDGSEFRIHTYDDGRLVENDVPKYEQAKRDGYKLSFSKRR